MVKHSRVLVGASLSIAVLVACSAEPPASTERVGTIAVNGLRLEYFDWGGRGVPLVLLAGSTDSPLQFLSLVPALTAQHRVLGLSRRGHGGSESPSAGFGLDDLVDDMRQMLDSLRIERAILLGMSFGGQEITRFAELFPERVLGLIYLDATLGFDDSLAVSEAMSAMPEGIRSLSDDDKVSWERFRDFYRTVEFGETPWTASIERQVRAIAQIGPDGRATFPAERVGPSLTKINLTYRRNYAVLQAPILAFVGDRFMPLTASRDTAVARRMTTWERDFVDPLKAADLERLRAAKSAARVLRLDQSHSQIQAQPLPVVTTEILAFTRSITGPG